MKALKQFAIVLILAAGLTTAPTAMAGGEKSQSGSFFEWLWAWFTSSGEASEFQGYILPGGLAAGDPDEFQGYIIPGG